MAVNLEGYEGPRALGPEEHEAVMELSRSVFFPERERFLDGAREWPMALHPDFMANTLAIFHEGKPVSLIGRMERDIVVHGHRLRLGYVGGVCTHPDHRKRGLAGAIQSASFRIFREHEVDFIYISGTRPMYYGAGADHTGGYSRFSVPPGAIDGAPAVTLRAATQEDVPLLGRLNERDGLSMLRTPTDYEVILAYGHCAGRPCRFGIVEERGVPVGYLFFSHGEREAKRSMHVLEARGERLAVLAGLAILAGERGSAGNVCVDVPHGDLLGELLAARGLPGTPGRSSGTVKVLDFCRTMGKLRPYFASHLGSDLAGSLQFIDAGSRYLVLSDAGTLAIDGEANLLWTLLGAPAGEEPSGVAATGEMVRLRERCLPVPLPSVYLNMI